MREGYIPDIRPFSKREKEKQPQTETNAQKTKQLTKLQTELSRLEDKLWVRECTPTPGMRTSKGMRRTSAWMKKIGQLKNEIQKRTFDLADQKTRDAIIQQAQDLHTQIASMKRVSTNPEIREQLNVSIRLQDLLGSLPDAIRAQLEKQFSSIPIDTDDEIYMQKCEEVAHEAIQHGIRRLGKTLHQIAQESGQLPTLILYPETSSRPLYYATKPLIDLIYTQAKQPLPKTHFIKAFSRHFDDLSFSVFFEYAKKEIEKQEKAQQTLMQARHDLLVRLKQNIGKRTRDVLSEKAHEYWIQIQYLKQEIQKKVEELERFTLLRGKDIISNRLDAIFKDTPSGPVLIIDDVLANGTTMHTVESVFHNKQIEKDLWYFTFLGIGVSSKKGPLYMPPDHLSIGVGNVDPASPTDPNKDLWIKNVEYTPESVVMNEDPSDVDSGAWLTLQSHGFPFRLDKERLLGVKKDEASPYPFVVPSKEGDPDKMKQTRQTYKSWGQEAVDALPAEFFMPI